MALRTETAQAWMKAIAVSLIVSAAGMIIQGLLLPFLTVLFPQPDVAPMSTAVAVFAGIAGGVFAIVIGALVGLLGLGVWNYKRWARIVMLVFAWIGGVVAVLFGLFMLVVLSFIGDVPGIDASLVGILQSPAFIALIIVIFLLFVALAAFNIWLFQFEPTVKSLFVASERTLVPSVDRSNAASIVRGLAINLWGGAIGLCMLGIVIAIAGPFLLGLYLQFAAASGQQVPAVVPNLTPIIIGAGIVFVAFAALLAFIGRGMWRLQPWSRVSYLVITIVQGVFVLGYAVVLPFVMPNVSQTARAYSSLLSSLLWIGVQIWLLQHASVRDVFSGVPATRTAARRKK